MAGWWAYVGGVRLHERNEGAGRTQGDEMVHRGGRRSTPLNWELLLGLVVTGFLIYVWVWAATQGGPPW